MTSIYSREFKPNGHHTIQAEINYQDDSVELRISDSRLHEVFEQVVTVRTYFEIVDYCKDNDCRYSLYHLLQTYSQVETEKAA